MDFITGSLPNVMFIAGLLAMGIGLGMEFKIVEIKSELSKQGRLGAIGLGAVLVSISIYLYTRPPQPASSPGTVAGAQPAVVQASVGGGDSVPQAARVTVVVTATPPASVTTASPTATPLPPTATAVAPTCHCATPQPRRRCRPQQRHSRRPRRRCQGSRCQTSRERASKMLRKY